MAAYSKTSDYFIKKTLNIFLCDPGFPEELNVKRYLQCSIFSRAHESSQPFPAHIYVGTCIKFVAATNTVCQSLG